MTKGIEMYQNDKCNQVLISILKFKFFSVGFYQNFHLFGFTNPNLNLKLLIFFEFA